MLNPDTKIDSKLSGDAKATAKGGIVAKSLHIVEHYKVDSDDDGDRKLSDPDEGDGETSGIDEGSASNLPSSELEALQMGIAAFTIGELESSASATSTHQDQKRFSILRTEQSASLTTTATKVSAGSRRAPQLCTTIPPTRW
jgi:hypothetical protein